jgi:flagellar protein FlaI
MAMDKQQKLEFESRLLERLYGKLHVLQSHQEREMIISKALDILFYEDEAHDRFKEEKAHLASDQAKKAFIHDFLSYGIIEDFMKDLDVEDIIINALKPIYIHYGQTGLTRTDKCFALREELDLFINKLVLFAGRSEVEAIMNIELPNLDGRVNIVKSPFGPQMTITKTKLSPISILDMVKNGTMSYEVAGQLWLYLEGMSIRPANMIIAGGPGVGKTTLLNALFSFIPERDRVVVIEDTLELNTDFDDSCSRLESGEDFDLAELVKNSLRMRPERVIIGEVRGEEGRDMMTAANIGKYCIGTIHALSAREAILRLQNEPMNVPEELVKLIDVFVILKRYHVNNRLFRVIDEVSETSGMEQQKILLSQIYKYDYEAHAQQIMATSTVYRDRLAQQASVTPKDIIMEVQLRAFLLQKLAERGHTTMAEVTAFCRAYNRNSDKALASMGFKREELLGKGFGSKKSSR